MTKLEKIFDKITDKFQLNPSGWIPHIKPDGIYEMGTSYDNIDDLRDGKGTPVPLECFSIYSVFWNICYNRRNKEGEAGRWEQFWSFLSDVDLGIYDTH